MAGLWEMDDGYLLLKYSLDNKSWFVHIPSTVYFFNNTVCSNDKPISEFPRE